MDVEAMDSESRARSVLGPVWVRPEFDWSCDDWRDSLMAPTNGGMTERRKAETIGELDTHLGYMMLELSTVSQELKEMREHFNSMVAMLVTKEQLAKEISDIRAEMANQSPSNLGRKIVWFAAGLSAIAGAFGVVVSVFRYLKL
jgi:hypothetical protein